MVTFHHWESLEGRATEGFTRDWEALFDRCSFPNPFLHPRWIDAWWRSFGGDARLQLWGFREGDRLVGVAALRLGWSRWRGLPVRRLSLLQNGQSRSGLLLAEDTVSLMPVVVSALERSARSWDVLELDGLSEEEHRLLTSSLSRVSGLRLASSSVWRESYLPLEGNWTDYLQHKTAKFRKTLRYADNVLERQGVVTTLAARTPEETAAAIEAFLDLDARSWKQNDGETLLGDRHLAEFYRALARGLGPVGVFTVWLLAVDRRPIAGAVCVSAGETLYTLKTGFDQAYSRFSPGTVLFRRIIEEAHRSRYRAIDFVGRMEFSERWTDADRTFARVVLTNRHLYSRTLGTLRRTIVRTFALAPQRVEVAS